MTENRNRNIVISVLAGTPLHYGSPLVAYILGALLVLVAGAGRMQMMKTSLQPGGVAQAPFVLFYPVIAMAAFVGGAGPGLLSLVAAAAYVGLLFPAPPDPLNCVVYAILGPLVIVTFVQWRKVRDASFANARESARFRLISDHASDWLFLVGESGKIEYTNETAARQLGYLPAELIGQPLDMLAVESHRLDVAEMLNRCRAGAASASEVSFTTREGKVVAVEAGCSAVRVAGELVLHVAARDITSRKQMEERLREARRWESLGVLAGGLAHDFNNLLTTVLGNASLAREYVGPRHPATQPLDGIEQAGERAAELIRMMLATAGYRSSYATKSRMEDVLEQALASGQMPAGIRIRTDVNAPPFPANQRSLATLLESLISNAAESYGASPDQVPSGEVRVTIRAGEAPHLGPGSFEEGERAAGMCLGIIVEDQGCGMSAEVLARAFDPFYSTKFTGRGLGLAAVRGLVRSHSGTLWIKTEAGKGTRVEIWLPGYLPSSTSSALASSS